MKVNGSDAELLKLLKRIDQSERLVLFAESELEGPSERCGLFDVDKSSTVDRLITDARPPNRKEKGLVYFARTLGYPAALTDVWLGPDEDMHLCCLDAADYYNRFIASRERAARNALCVSFPARMLKGFKSLPKGVSGGARLVPGVQTLSMGNLNAVEFGRRCRNWGP